MKKFLLLAAGLAALAGSACSKAPECTSEELAGKAQEMTAAVQEAVTKDPSKAAELMAKVQDVVKKYQNSSTTAEACNAYDEVITAIKG